MQHNPNHQHEVLYVGCGKCRSQAITVIIMQGIVLFDCYYCKAEIGAIEKIEEETKELLSKGCQSNHG